MAADARLAVAIAPKNVSELRGALKEARLALGLPTISVGVRAIHLQQLRGGL